MVRRKDLIGNLPGSLLAHAAGRSASAFDKLERAKKLIEADVAEGIVRPQDVTLKMLLKDRAGLNHRFLDREAYANQKEHTLDWIGGLGAHKCNEAPSPEEIIAQLEEEIATLQVRLERMSDRVHFYASRIRELQRANKQLKKKSLETVVYLRDSASIPPKTP